MSEKRERQFTKRRSTLSSGGKSARSMTQLLPPKKGYLQVPRVLRGIETWTKLWFAVEETTFFQRLVMYPSSSVDKVIGYLNLREVEFASITPWVDSTSTESVSQGDLWMVVVFLKQNRIFIFGKVMEDEAKRWCDAVFPPDCEQFLANSDGNFDKEKKKKSTLRRKIEKRDRSKTNTALEIPKIDLSGNISPKKDPPTPRQNSFRSLRGSSAVMVGDKRAHKKSSEDLIGRGPIVHNNEHFYHDSELFDHRVHADKTDVVLLELQGANVTLKSIPFPSQIRISQVSVTTKCGLAVGVGGQVYVWGEQNQSSPILGLGHTEKCEISSPVEIPNPFEQGDLVAEASCGTKTSALVSRQGLVALWGLVAYDDGPQMATVTTPTLYHPLRHKFVTNVVTSENVCIALIHVPGMDDVTEVWSWGAVEGGLLGHGDSEEIDKDENLPSFAAYSPRHTIRGIKEVRAPREIVALSNETVVSVSVSLTHALCATSHGNVYVWGNNRYRKSGDFEVQGFLGVKDPPILYKPKNLRYFGGTSPFLATKVIAGVAFSLAMLATKSVVSWGYRSPCNYLARCDGGRALEQQPSIIQSLPQHDVEDVLTDGEMSVAKTKDGLWVWGCKDVPAAETGLIHIPSFKILKHGLVLNTRASIQKSLVVLRGTDFATIISSDESRVISASWHKTVEHLMALVERVWKKSSFIIFDSLGRDCHPTDHTSQLIQEMLLRNVRPVFIVTDVSALLRGYESRIRLRKGAIEWGEQDMLLQLLFLFPSSSLCQPPSSHTQVSSNSQPERHYGYWEVFFLTFSKNFKMEPLEVFEKLRGHYATLADRISEDEPEDWIPQILAPEVRVAIQQQINRTRMRRLLLSLRKWLEVRPADFVCSSNLMVLLLEFLHQQCQNKHYYVHAVALEVRRSFLFQMSKQRFSRLANKKNGSLAIDDTESSLLLRYDPRVIAEQLTWIDANRVLIHITAYDALFQRAPMAVPRHTTLGCWAEREVLECPSDAVRIRLVEALLEVMYHLILLRNWFSYSSLYGAFQQRGIRQTTGKVWETGAKLKPRSIETLRFLKEETEYLKAAAKFNKYFEELPMPKLPYLGHIWQKGIYINERNKAAKPPTLEEAVNDCPPGLNEGNEKIVDVRKKKRLLYWEGARADAETALWLGDLVSSAISQYAIVPNGQLIHALSQIKGFKSDPLQHRKLADEYTKKLGTGAVDLDDGDTGPDDSVALLQSINQDSHHDDDVEAMLLSGRASLVSISNRMRNDVWSEVSTFFFVIRESEGSVWLMLLKREREDTIMEEQATKALPPGLAPPGQQHSWSVIKQHLERIRDFVVPPLTQIHDPMDGLNSPLLSPDAFDVGFSSLLFRSQALEVTMDSMLSSYPTRQSTAKIMEAILTFIFGKLFGAPAFLGAVEELSTLDPETKNLKFRTRDAILSILGTAKALHPILLLSDDAFYAQVNWIKTGVEYFWQVIQNWSVQYERTAPLFPGSEWDRFEASMQEDVWESFSLMANIRNLFGPLSIICNCSHRLTIDFRIPELNHAKELLQNQRNARIVKQLKSAQETAQNLESEVQGYMQQLGTAISTLQEQANPSKPIKPAKPGRTPKIKMGTPPKSQTVSSISHTALMKAQLAAQTAQNEGEQMVQKVDDSPKILDGIFSSLLQKMDQMKKQTPPRKIYQVGVDALDKYVEHLNKVLIPQLRLRMQKLDQVIILVTTVHSQIKELASSIVEKQYQQISRTTSMEQTDQTTTILNRLAKLNLSELSFSEDPTSLSDLSSPDLCSFSSTEEPVVQVKEALNLVSSLHQHKLELSKRQKFSCDQCNKLLQNKCYVCEKCQFFLCRKCFSNSQVKEGET